MNSEPEDWEQLVLPIEGRCSTCGKQLKIGSIVLWSPSKEIANCLLHDQSDSDLDETPLTETGSILPREHRPINASGFSASIDTSKFFSPIDIGKLLNPLGVGKLLTPMDISKLLSPVNTQFSGLNRSFAASLAKIALPLASTGAMAKLVADLKTSQAQILSGLNLDSIKALAAEFKNSQPKNFQEMRLIDQLRLIKMSVDHGFGTVESLPKEVILILLEKDDGSEKDVNSVLVESTNPIVQYCMAKAQEVIEMGAEPLVGYATLIFEAGKALAAGHYSSSQTLSTAIWDSSLTATFGTKMITQVKKSHGNSIEIDLDNRDKNVTMKEIYRKAAQFPAVSTYPAGKDHSRYSRNGTIHYATPAQFNPANALKAMTIACGILAFAARYTVESKT